MKTSLVKVQATRNYLVVKFTVKDQVVAQQHTVRVPWAELLTLHEPLMNGIEEAALKRLGNNRGQYELPLERWE